MTVAMPTWAATWRAAASLSPVSSTGSSPRSRSRETASADDGLIVSPTTMHAAGLAVPADRDRRTSLALRAVDRGGKRRIEVLRPVLEQPGPPDDDGVALDDALDAEAVDVREVFDRRQRRPSTAAMARRDRVLGRGLEGRGEAAVRRRRTRRRRPPRRGPSSRRWSPCPSCRARSCPPGGSTRAPRVP